MTERYSERCNRVFEIFGEISKIPRGSGHRTEIANFCIDFARKHGLKYVCDKAENVIIYKQASKDCKNKEPVILQGHLDMVWQKSADSKIDFLKDAIEIYKDGDFVKANGTTLGADNGIAVAIVLSILERDDLPHPKIEAVFTSDEEIGMLGAVELDTSLVSGKKLINLDSEDDDTVTVSCAGGSDFKAVLPIKRATKKAEIMEISLFGLKGGHSGVEINKNRVNANILSGRLLNYLNENAEFDLVSINGGDKANAIVNCCSIVLCADRVNEIVALAEEYLGTVKAEISAKEPNFSFELKALGQKEALVFDKSAKEDIIYTLNCTPNAIIEMSAEIEGLVETSLNLGILQTQDDEVTIHYALRSNKASSLEFLEDKMKCFFSKVNAKISTFGHYPPWEYKDNSSLKNLYLDVYTALFSETPKVEAIHAGLECAVFSSSIKNSDCIAIGPTILDAHTVNERLSIASTEKVYDIVLNMLEKLAK